MHRFNRLRSVALLGLLATLLAACAPPSGPPPIPTPTVAPPTAPVATPSASTARQYELGKADVEVSVGRGVVEPLELRGTLALPSGSGPHPVVVVLHGSHAVCPMEPQSPEEPEICPQVSQIRNDPGLGYLLDALAARGAIALAPDLNTAFRAEFAGLIQESGRVQFVVERHLERLAAADPAFGLGPGVSADSTRLFLIGHSRGGLGAYQLAATWAAGNDPPAGWSQPGGLLLLAPLVPQTVDFAPPLDLPLAVVLPECDGDVALLDGQHYTEAARMDPHRTSPATTYFLRGANHNFFNAGLALDDSERALSRCLATTPRLPRESQQRFLAGLAPALLDAWERGAIDALPGVAAAELSPTELFDAPAEVVTVRPAAQRRAILPGLSSGELTTSPLGGTLAVTNAELDFCPYGMVGNGSPCRQGVELPGMPAMLHLAWDTAGAGLQVPLPAEAAAGAVALQLRLASDPLDPRSPAGQAQQLRIVLRDSAGGEATQTLEMAFPQGGVVRDGWYGHVFPATVRLPLASFAGLDPAQLVSLELRPEAPAGALFLAGLELVSDGAAIGGPPAPSPYRRLSGTVAVPELASVPADSTLTMRLFAAGDAAPRFVTIQPEPASGTLPLLFTLPYHQAAIDERRDYQLDAILQLPDGRFFNSTELVAALTAGVVQPRLALELAQVEVVEPTPVPTDAVLVLTVRAPAGLPLPPGSNLSAVLSRLDTDGLGVDTLAISNTLVGDAAAESVEIQLPYASSALRPGERYGVSVDVFGADGISRIAGTIGNQLVDPAAGTATVALTAVSP